MFARLSMNRKVHEMVRSLYGNKCNSMIRPLVKYQKRQTKFDVVWSDELHTAIGCEITDGDLSGAYDFYMLKTSDLEFK